MSFPVVVQQLSISINDGQRVEIHVFLARIIGIAAEIDSALFLIDRQQIDGNHRLQTGRQIKSEQFRKVFVQRPECF